MEGFYEVYMGKQLAGKVQLKQEGLYYRVICRCMVNDEQVYRLFAVMGDRKENLGVLVPDTDGIVLNRKIPVKRFLGEKPEFHISSNSGIRSAIFVPICPEEPFLYIERLKNTFLASQNGKVGIHIVKEPEAG